MKKTWMAGIKNYREYRIHQVWDAIELDTWDERDRCMMEIYWKNKDKKTIIALWDEDARTWMEEGWHTGDNLKNSLIDYCLDVGLIPE